MRLLLIIALITIVRADWWDSFTTSVSDGIHSAATWVKDTASPVIRTKFNDAKETLQDPETHKVVQKWVSEKANLVKTFAEEEVAPELKKIYEAAKAAAASGSEEQSTSRSVDVPGK
ncbi:unnamed protein product [Heligmosomoides polygyrus]|uniref:Secreted protein n=1 Tax=Heligmosomoides polygyrus TaxID=6339 RepID=A0A183GQ34_HELPZ|nr:unnamed protein product [Heligmosomoides polygyrus]